MPTLNFLMPLKGVATKTFNFENDEWVIKESYKAGKWFKGFSSEVSSIEEAFDILEENQKHPCFMIQGAIIDGTDTTRMIRRSRTNKIDNLKPTITDRNLTLFCLDVDGYEGGIESFILTLPEEFHTADYIYQYSASYGLTSHKVDLRCHLFFWLHEPIHTLDLRNWAKNCGISAIDSSVLKPAQPVYIQRRICEGNADPVTDFIGLVKKGGKLVWEPEIEQKSEYVKKTDPNKFNIASSIEKILKAENYHEELNSLALSLINRKVPANTVKSMLKGAMNAANIKDNRWKERYEDINRSVDSATDIVNNPTIEEIIDWVNENDPQVVVTDFASRCVNLSPTDKVIALNSVSKRTGFGIRPLNKTLKMAEEEAKEEAKLAAREHLKMERESRGVYEIECTAINSGEASKKAGDILAKSEKSPGVYVLGNKLTSISMGIPSTIRQCHKVHEMGNDYPKMPVIQPYNRPYYSLGGRLEQDMVFINEGGSDIECPTRVLHMVGEAHNSNFKPLTGIVEHPFIDANWELMQKKGYDKKTGLFTVLHNKLKITKMDPKEAYDYLANVVFDEFPFAKPLDKAVAVSALLTATQRPTIAGDTGMPGFGIVSPIQSSGKTTLAQLISYSIYNRPVAASSWSDDDEELGKHILGILQEGHSCVLFDNIKQGAAIQSGRLANAMSNDIFGGRQLGENRTIQVPSSVTWIFTGNAIKFVGDFATRIYPITINPNMEDPNTRSFKRHDIGQWAMDNRKKIMSAVLSIVVSGKGMEEIGGSSRFKLWDKFVRRPIYKVSGIDINDAVKNNQKDDPLQLAKSNLLSSLYETFGGKKFTSKDIKSMAFGSFEAGETDLSIALEEVFGDKARNIMSVGRYMGSMIDTVINGYVLRRIQSSKSYWLVEKK